MNCEQIIKQYQCEDGPILSLDIHEGYIGYVGYADLKGCSTPIIVNMEALKWRIFNKEGWKNLIPIRSEKDTEKEIQKAIEVLHKAVCKSDFFEELGQRESFRLNMHNWMKELDKRVK